jgi:flagellar hook-associated protein 3
MLSGIHGQDGSFLTGLSRIESRISKATESITTGMRVNVASDDASAVAPILRYQEQIDHLTQVQKNLVVSQSDGTSADNALQSATSILDNISSLASQGLTLSADDNSRKILSDQVQALQSQLVSIANTQVRGNYIFGGDNRSVPPYTLDPASPNGVVQNSPGISTLTVMDANGFTHDATLSAREIFDTPGSTSGAILTDAVLGATPALDDTANPGIAQSFTFRVQGQKTPINVSLPGIAGGYTTQASLLAAVQGSLDTALGAGTPPLAAGTITAQVDANGYLRFKGNGSQAFTVTDNGADDTAMDSPAGIGAGNPGADNIFAAVASLSVALLSNDIGGIKTAIEALKLGNAHLQTSNAFYGNVLTWLNNAQATAGEQLANLQNAMHVLQDTDMPAAITTLTTSNTALQAAISAHASLPTKTLFDYLG